MGVFKWLNGLIHGRKDTEIRRLRAAETAKLDECRQAAAQGDHEAQLRLKEYSDTLDAQSVRLLRGAKPAK